MRKSRSGAATIFIGICMVIIGAAAILFALITPESELVTNSQDITYSSNEVYDMGQVLVIDKYGYIENTKDPDEDYYLVAYYTQDGAPHLASLRVTEDEDIFNKLDSYAEDDTAYIGDLYINLCAKAEPMSSIEPELIGYYNDALDLYAEYLTGIDDSQVSLVFYCEGAEAFPAALEEENTSHIFVVAAGAVIAVLGIILFITGINKKKKEKIMQAQMAQQGAYYNTVNQPDVYYNPQAGANQWNNGTPYQQPQNGANQWNNSAQYQQPQNGYNQWSNQTAQVNSQPDATNTNQYYTPPTENNTSQTNAPEDSAQNNQQ